LRVIIFCGKQQTGDVTHDKPWFKRLDAEDGGLFLLLVPRTSIE